MDSIIFKRRAALAKAPRTHNAYLAFLGQSARMEHARWDRSSMKDSPLAEWRLP